MTEPRGTTIYVDVVCDLFHPGHLGFFAKVREMGERLIVGVVSDANVMTYKPPPIMTLAERCEMLRACRLVDRVIPDPPLFCTCAFLDEIGADFACHGDDMSDTDLYYWYKDVIDGKRFKTVRYSEGISSREIVRRVLDRRVDR